MATAAKSRSAKPVADAYFGAIARRDLDGLAACWASDGVDHLIGVADLAGPEGVRGFFGELFGAFPDFDLRVQQTVAQSGRVAVHWNATGTFAGPGTFQGLQPTGARIEFEGMDVLHVSDGLIVRNDACADQMTLARQIGLVPSPGSPIEERMTRVFNARTRVRQRALAGEAEQIADGVWLLRGGLPVKSNVYLIEEPSGGVTVFDAGVRQMSGAIAAAGAALGGIQRVVLGHSHPDHRGAAPALRAPVFCHPAERADAEGDGGLHYFDYSRLRLPPARWTARWLLEKGWNGGPVDIAGTVDEGDDIAGFRVIHLPGHAPGQIALLRDSDRVALTSDAFYTFDVELTVKVAPRLPHEAYNHDTEQARASLRKLAAMEPSVAWPGHANPVTGDVRGQLERAAAG